MPSALEHLARTSVLAPWADAVDLHRFLALVPDPWDPRGRRYPMAALVSAAAAAVLAGARSLTAIGE
ncbi:hypothetical protein AB0D73_34605 [Streptomyces sp. NPDC048215]|uniref:hypothetical protein n=1 Tax=Streptomyces TaxID=1883 RepID=UPI002E15F901|nr:hypothetical protein OG483_07055 [[Kitasatospora] papulosa]